MVSRTCCSNFMRPMGSPLPGRFIRVARFALPSTWSYASVKMPNNALPMCVPYTLAPISMAKAVIRREASRRLPDFTLRTGNYVVKQFFDTSAR